MNLLQIRQKFIQLSGRNDLVADLTNYVDAGANFFINAGLRKLTEIFPYKDEVWIRRPVAIGEYMIPIPNVRTVHAGMGVFFDTVDSRYDLEKADEKYIKENYASPDNGTPEYYAICNGVLGGEEYITNGDFSTITGWTAGGWALLPGGGVTNTLNLSPLVQPLSAMAKRPYTYGRYLISYRTDGHTLGGGLQVGMSKDLLFAYQYGPERIKGGQYSEFLYVYPQEADLVFQPIHGVVSGVKLYSVSMREVGMYDTEILQANRAGMFKYIKLSTPPDQVIELGLYCTVYPDDLSLDYEENWWTRYKAMQVVWAALYMLEVSYRNTEGAKDWMNSIVEDMSGMQKDRFVEMSDDYNQVEG